MTRKRISMVGLPPLMEELVRRAFMSDPLVQLVTQPFGTLDAFLDDTTPHSVDVVITCADLNSTSTSRNLLDRHPSLRVLVIERQDGQAMLYELRPFRTFLGPVSPVEIVRAVKDDAAHADAWAMFDSGTQSPEP